MNEQRIAVVGSGVAGLGAAWLLGRRHRVTLFEREARFGGYANTVVAPLAGGSVAVDTGFIVYNTACYPNLIALFDHLRVPTAPTNMSFAVSLDGGRYEYSGTGAHGLFGQPANLLNAAHWRMTADILRFFRDARRLLGPDADEQTSLGDWLAANGYSAAFRDRHILPMAAAIWSTPERAVLQFPVAAFARFFAHHGLLQVRSRPQWRTVRGGSREYVRRLLDDAPIERVAGVGVERVERGVGDVKLILQDGAVRAFDQVVLACHADTALALLAAPSAAEREVLGAFRYVRNRAVLHGDPAHMPRRRRLWSSWNFLGGCDPDRVAVSYWMNRLQPLTTDTDLFVTLNPVAPVDPGRVVETFDYDHPLFDAAAMAAQRRLWRLQGERGTWFAGSYAGYGFHEDALQSGLAVAEAAGGVRRPWSVAGESDRIHQPPASWRAPLAEVSP